MTSSARITALLLVTAGVLGRLVPHPWNMTPLAGASLFAGATLPLHVAIAVPLATFVVSDLVIGLHPVVWATWGACVAGSLLGRMLRGRHRVTWIVGLSVANSTTFFVLSNFAVWLQSGMYPHSVGGFVACYVAAIPFFQHSLVGDLAWTGVFFGGWALAGWFAQQLQQSNQSWNDVTG